MTWSAAAVRNLKFFSPLGGAAAAFIDYRRRRLESFNFFPSVGGAAAQKFTNEKFFQK